MLLHVKFDQPKDLKIETEMAFLDLEAKIYHLRFRKSIFGFQ